MILSHLRGLYVINITKIKIFPELLMPDKGLWFPLSILPIRKQLLILLIRNGSKPAARPCVRHRLLLPLNSELNENRSSAL